MTVARSERLGRMAKLMADLRKLVDSLDDCECLVLFGWVVERIGQARCVDVLSSQPLQIELSELEEDMDSQARYSTVYLLG
jgi:hypothetical protein